MELEVRMEVQAMIDLAIARHHTENVARLTSIEQRIIGIDGNGTGRIGAVQRIELAISSLTSGLESLKESLGEVKIDIGGSLKTKTLWAVGGAIGVAVLGASGSLFATWLERVIGWK